MASAMNKTLAIALAFFTLIVDRCLASSTDAESSWIQAFPNNPMPEPLRGLLSPLSADQVSKMVDLIQAEGLLALDADTFCSESKVLCWENANSLAFDGCLCEGGRRKLLIVRTCQQRFGSLESKVREPFFIRLSNLTPGTTLTLFSAELGPQLTAPRSFLPQSLANLIPFSSAQLNQVLQALQISAESDMATAMATNLQRCEEPDEKGIDNEDRACVTSLEEMISFITFRLGTNKLDIHTFFSDPTIMEKPLTVVETRLLSSMDATKISCHMLSYPYQVFYCHALHKSELHLVTARTENGQRVNGLAASCHMDTSRFNTTNAALHALKIKPGEGEVCHLLVKTLVFIKN